MKREADLLVGQAERNARVARARLLATLAEIRHRIDPRVIAAETAEGALARANHLLDDAKTAIKDRPAITAASGVAFAAAVGLRFWLAKGKDDGKDDAT